MTVEKCIQIADEAIKTLKIPDEMMDISFMYKCREALEKQISKNVIKSKHGYNCPVCDAFWSTFGGNFIDTNYCPNCGQAIDWSEEVKE